MEKSQIEIFNLLAIVAIASIPFLKTKGRGILTMGIITVQVAIISVLAFSVFANGPVEYFYPGSFITGAIPIRIDYLSAWFILVRNPVQYIFIEKAQIIVREFLFMGQFSDDNGRVNFIPGCTFFDFRFGEIVQV